MSLAGGERKAKKKSWKVDGEKQFAEQQQKAFPNRKTAFSPQKHYRVFYHSGGELSSGSSHNPVKVSHSKSGFG